MSNEWLTPQQAAERLGYSVETVRAMLRDKSLSGRKVKGRWQVKAAEVEQIWAVKNSVPFQLVDKETTMQQNQQPAWLMLMKALLYFGVVVLVGLAQIASIDDIDLRQELFYLEICIGVVIALILGVSLLKAFLESLRSPNGRLESSLRARLLNTLTRPGCLERFVWAILAIGAVYSFYTALRLVTDLAIVSLEARSQDPRFAQDRASAFCAKAPAILRGAVQNQGKRNIARFAVVLKSGNEQINRWEHENPLQPNAWFTFTHSITEPGYYDYVASIEFAGGSPDSNPNNDERRIEIQTCPRIEGFEIQNKSTPQNPPLYVRPLEMIKFAGGQDLILIAKSSPVMERVRQDLEFHWTIDRGRPPEPYIPGRPEAKYTLPVEKGIYCITAWLSWHGVWQDNASFCIQVD